MASDCTVSFSDYICFIKAYLTELAALGSASRLISPEMIS